MRQQNLGRKVLVVTNIVSLLFLAIVSLHYKVPQRVLNRLKITNFTVRNMTYTDYRIQALHSIGTDKEGFANIMLGDSITAGGNWEKLLKGVDVANYGIGGDTTAGLLLRLSDVYMAKPQRVFLMIGINDIGARITVGEILKNIEEIVEKMNENEIKIIIQSTLYVSKKPSNWEIRNKAVDDLNKGLQELCIKNNLLYIDLNTVLSDDGALNKKYTNDGVHLLENGYNKWKELIIPIMKAPEKMGV
jgi:lysophospholipase L1-like esterase